MRQAATAVTGEHYVHRLDLGMDPFVEGFHSDYFYTGAQRKYLVEQALHFSRFSDQIVLLIGSTGSGTSTLLDQLLDQLEPVMDFCSLDAESVTSPEQILNTLAGQLQFPQVGSVTEFVAELRHAEHLDENREPLLIAVDQAHFLGMEALELLSYLYTQAAGAVHLLLVGEYQVEQLLKLTGFEPGRLKVLELEPLDREQTGEYLLGLLHSVGYAGEQPLSTDQLSVLHEQSGGNLAEINLLVPKLLTAQSKETRKFQLAIPVSHIAAVVILLIAIGLSYWYDGGGDDSPAVETPAVAVMTKPQAASGGSPADEGPADEGPVRQTVKSVDLAAVIRSKEEAVAGDETALSLNEEVKNTPDTAGEAGIEGKTQGAVNRNGAKETLSSALVKKPESDRPMVTLTDNSAPRAEKSAQGKNPVEAKPVAAAPLKLAPVPRAKVKVSEAQLSEVEAPAKVETSAAGMVSEAKASTAAAKPEAVKAISMRERRLLNMPGSGFVLQLMGAQEEERAKKMVATYAGRLPITYYESRRQNKPWYVVVTGPYSDKQAARAGRDVLPAELQRQQPWPRSVAGVQEEIRSNSQ